MRNLILSAIAASLLFANCTEKDLVSGDDSQNLLSSAKLSSTENIGSTSKSYIILSRQLAVSDKLLQRIGSIGKVKSSMRELGIVVASSSNPNFEQEIESLTEVQNVVQDIKLDWLKSTLQRDKVVALSEVQKLNANVNSVASMGLSGTNPFLPLQWNLLSVNAKGAFEAGYKGAGALVAVLDGGFHLEHPDIKDNVIGFESFVPGEPAQMQNPFEFSHGTHVAGIIAASDDDNGIVGIAPSSKLMLLKVIGNNGSGDWSWIIQGVYYAANRGADIINMSLGAPIPRNGQFIYDNGTPDDPTDDIKYSVTREIQDLIVAMNRSFQYARKKGSLPIVAAGNEYTYVTGQGQLSFYPADCAGVLAIAANAPQDWALNQNNSLFIPASYTNYGSSLISLAGPGGDFDGSEMFADVAGFFAPSFVFDLVISPASLTDYWFAAGTSMACPAVSGVAALIAGKYKGNISPTQLESKLKKSAIDAGAAGHDDYFGNGQVNAANAVRQ